MAKIKRESLQTMGEALQWLVDLDAKLMRARGQGEIDQIAQQQLKAIGKAKRGLMMARDDGFDFRRASPPKPVEGSMTVKTVSESHYHGAEQSDPKVAAAASTTPVIRSVLAKEYAAEEHVGRKHKGNGKAR